MSVISRQSNSIKFSSDYVHSFYFNLLFIVSQDKIEKLECENKNLRNECIADKEKIKNLTNSLVSVTKSKDQLRYNFMIIYFLFH